MTVYLGIDIASKKFDVAELCDGNYRCKLLKTHPLDFWPSINGLVRAQCQTFTHVWKRLVTMALHSPHFCMKIR